MASAATGIASNGTPQSSASRVKYSSSASNPVSRATTITSARSAGVETASPTPAFRVAK
jgi:hypothetical protein